MATPESDALPFKPLLVIGALVVALAGAVSLLGNWESPRHDNNAQLDAVRAAALEYAEAGGRLPANLDQLIEAGHLKEKPKDRWGNPIRYEVDAEGREATLTSLGPDQKEGGVMMKRDTTIRIEWK